MPALKLLSGLGEVRNGMGGFGAGIVPAPVSIPLSIDGFS